MLKTVSSITNAIGALNYKGTWNASTNSPSLTSSVGTKGDYYVVNTAGTTTLNGISNWGIGDWAVFNGSVWQRVEGGADLSGVNLSVSGTSTFGDNATFSTAAKGVDFSANTPAAGMTSQLLNWYEEGTWTPTVGGTATYALQTGKYTRIGRQVNVQCILIINAIGTGSTNIVSGLPFTADIGVGGSVSYFSDLASPFVFLSGYASGTTFILTGLTAASAAINGTSTVFKDSSRVDFSLTYFV